MYTNFRATENLVSNRQIRHEKIMDFERRNRIVHLSSKIGANLVKSGNFAKSLSVLVCTTTKPRDQQQRSRVSSSYIVESNGDNASIDNIESGINTNVDNGDDKKPKRSRSRRHSNREASIAKKRIDYWSINKFSRGTSSSSGKTCRNCCQYPIDVYRRFSN